MFGRFKVPQKTNKIYVTAKQIFLPFFTTNRYVLLTFPGHRQSVFKHDRRILYTWCRIKCIGLL